MRPVYLTLYTRSIARIVVNVMLELQYLNQRIYLHNYDYKWSNKYKPNKTALMSVLNYRFKLYSRTYWHFLNLVHVSTENVLGPFNTRCLSVYHSIQSVRPFLKFSFSLFLRPITRGLFVSLRLIWGYVYISLDCVSHWDHHSLHHTEITTKPFVFLCSLSQR